MWFVVLLKVAVWFLGGSHLSPRLPWKKTFFFFLFLMSGALFNQSCDQNLCYIVWTCTAGLCNCSFLCAFRNDSLFCFHAFPAAALLLLLMWSCPGRLWSVSISWCTRPFQSWEPHTGAPGTSGCLHCWWLCFGSWDFTCIIWASGSSFGRSQFLLQSKSC